MDPIQFTDLMELADIIAERLGNPITIEDQHHQVVAYSIHGETPDPVRIETIMKRKVPETVLARFWKAGVIQSLMHSDQPVRIPSIQELGLGNRIAISIRKGTEVLGYIWVQETGRPLVEEDYGILRWAARLAMPRLLQKRDRYIKKEENKKALFWQILSGNCSLDEIHQEAATLSIYFPPYMVVVAGEIKCKENQWLSIQKELDYLLENLKETTPFSFLPLWVYDEKQCIILGGAKKMDGLEEEAGSFLMWLNNRFSVGKGIQIKTGGFGS
ncbi:MAG TPA: transcriptional regulator, partial [Paenibacillaceae bacterium]|nr:transcriptional regulator [Paenibacillaceae bacterium]